MNHLNKSMYLHAKCPLVTFIQFVMKLTSGWLMHITRTVN